LLLDNHHIGGLLLLRLDILLGRRVLLGSWLVPWVHWRGLVLALALGICRRLLIRHIRWLRWKVSYDLENKNNGYYTRVMSLIFLAPQHSAGGRSLARTTSQSLLLAYFR
jgi:hypothetical protein